MINLETRSKQYCIVINAPVDFNKPVDKLHDYLKCIDTLTSSGVQYFAIIHDKDFNGNGELKTPHIHLIYSCSNRPRVKKVINDLSSLLNCNDNQIQVQNCVDLSASIQYLTHKNDMLKTQYSFKDVVTNVDLDKLQEYYTKDINCLDLTFDDLTNIYYQCNGNRLLIMKTIGLGRYNTYRSTINDFIQYIRTEDLNNEFKKQQIKSGIKQFDDF